MLSRFSFYAISLSLILFITACISQKKVIATWEELRKKEAQLTSTEKKLDSLNTAIERKLKSNEVDDTTAARIRRFIGISKNEIGKLQAQNDILKGKTAIDKTDWPAIRNNLELTDAMLKKTADKLELIADLLSRSLVIKIDQDIIFEPGQYKLSEKTAQPDSKIFEPAANEIENFIKKYPGVDLSVVVNANGFADGTSIAESSALYKDLKSRIKSGGAKEMNIELSKLRAEDVMNQFKNYFSNRFKSGAQVRNILYTFEGKGEEYPNPKINDYKTDDARRRVVLLYWSVFPE